MTVVKEKVKKKPKLAKRKQTKTASEDKQLKNSDVADIFEEIADLLEIQGANPYRARAYRNAADKLRILKEPVASLSQDGLVHLEGIGKDLASKIHIAASGGNLPLLKQLRSKAPAEIRSLIHIPGLGPKRIHTLFEQLGVHNMETLKNAAQRHQIQDVPGFGAKTEQRIADAVLQVKKMDGKRVYYAKARPYAEALRDYLKKDAGVKQIDIAGSYRRRKETVGDLDILVACQKSEAVMDRLADFKDVKEVLLRGDTKMSVQLSKGLQVDLRVVPESSYGAALQYFTGSKAHSIALRQRAQMRGLKVNEYGVFKDDEMVAGQTEEEVYQVLGLPWIPPELREGHGELELAEHDRLPKLLELENIKGDLHMHTRASDGHATIQEMIKAAKERGLSYIAITEHSRRATIANGLDPKRLRQHWQMIDKAAEDIGGITVLKGVEMDILEDGSLDLPDDVLREADWVIASLHYGLRQPKNEITKRVLSAMRNRYVSAIGHPTGRIIGKREPVEIDFDTIVKAAADYGCMLELDAQPKRLDLNEFYLHQAKNHQVPIVINSDAHSTEDLAFMEYGVFQARRAGLERADVANTRNVTEFRKLLRTSH